MALPYEGGYYFPSSIKKMLVAFAELHSSYYMPVYEPDPANRNVRKWANYLIPIRMLTEERFIAMYKDFAAGQQTVAITLPLIAFNVDAISVDDDKIRHNMNKTFSVDRNEYIMSPVPIKLDMTMNIYTKMIGELFDVFEMILPKYQKARYYPFMEYKFADGSTIDKDLVVEITGHNFEIANTDLGQADSRVVNGSMTFSISGGSLYHIVKDTSTNSHGQQVGGGDGPGSKGIRMDGKTIRVIDIKYEEMVSNKFEELQTMNSLSTGTTGKIITNMIDQNIV